MKIADVKANEEKEIIEIAHSEIAK